MSDEEGDTDYAGSESDDGGNGYPDEDSSDGDDDD